MTDVIVAEDTIQVAAPPSAVFGFCLDPRQLFAGDPKHVVDADVVPGGVGTTAHLSMKMGVLEEDDRLEYVEVVPDRRIEIAMQPTVSVSGLKQLHTETALYTLAHEFEPDGEGTRMTLRVVVHDPPLYERLIGKLEVKSADRLVHNRLRRIADAIEDSAAEA